MRVVLIASFMMVFGYFLFRESHYSNFSILTGIVPLTLGCVVLNFPLLVSVVILRFVKHSVSLIILLLSTVLFGIGMSYALYETWGYYECMSGIQFFGVSYGSLFSYMIPAWIIVIFVEKRNRKKSAEPDNSRSTG